MWYLTSVTRFGRISPLSKFSKTSAVLGGLFVNYCMQWAKFHLCKWPKLKTNFSFMVRLYLVPTKVASNDVTYLHWDN